MAGSHRAPHRRRSPAVPRWAIVIALVLALIPATALTAKRVFDTSSSPSHSSTDLPIPPVTPSATSTLTTPSTTPSSTPSKRPTSPAKHLQRIASDSPRRITSGDVIDSGFDSSVTDLDASSDSEVARWDPRGSPGSPGTDTVFVVGRVRAGTDSAFAGLDRLHVGDKVSIRTDSGTLTYTVRTTRLEPEAGLDKSAQFKTHKRGRLILLGIRYDASGQRLTKSLVVTAELTGAKKA